MTAAVGGTTGESSQDFLVTLATPWATKAPNDRTGAAAMPLGPLASQGEPIFAAIKPDPTR